MTQSLALAGGPPIKLIGRTLAGVPAHSPCRSVLAVSRPTLLAMKPRASRFASLIITQT